jgi:hypothetical protein
MRFSLGNAMRRGPPGLFRKECASCEGGGRYVGVYGKRKNAQEIENKGRNVATGMRRIRVVRWVFERKSTVHSACVTISTYCQVVLDFREGQRACCAHCAEDWSDLRAFPCSARSGCR